MGKLIFILAFNFLGTQFFTPSQTATQSSQFCMAEQNIITMEDDILLVNTGSPFDDVLGVFIYSSEELVFQGNGCGSFACEYNLEQLGEGTYTVIVKTENEETFSDTIVIE